MSLAINVDAVTYVQIAGEWWPVANLPGSDVSSFDLDAYEFTTPDAPKDVIQDKNNTTGFVFIVGGWESFTGKMMSGPMSSIQAVIYGE